MSDPEIVGSGDEVEIPNQRKIQGPGPSGPRPVLVNQLGKGGSAHPARPRTPWGLNPAPAVAAVAAVVKARAAPAPPTAMPAMMPATMPSAMPPGRGGRRSERRRGESDRGDGRERKLTEHVHVSSLWMRCALRIALHSWSSWLTRWFSLKPQYRVWPEPEVSRKFLAYSAT